MTLIARAKDEAVAVSQGSAFKPFAQYIERCDLNDLPIHFREALDPVELSLSGIGSSPPELRVFAAWAGNWWFTQLDGRGVVQARGDRGRMSADYILLALGLSGRNWPSGPIRFLPRPGEIILMPWAAGGGFISSGEFKQMFVFLPKADLANAGLTDINDIIERPISALGGVGAVLSSALRTLFSQASRAHSRSEAAKALPGVMRLIVDAFLTGEPSTKFASAPEDPIRHITEYLRNHISMQGLSAEHAAMACGLSKRQLFRCFASADLNFAGSLREIRVEHARELLAFRPDLSIEEVAASTGFSSSSHFIRVFRSVLGTTPLSYRRRQRSYQVEDVP